LFPSQPLSFSCLSNISHMSEILGADVVIRIKPFHYIHVLDNNTNATRVVIGPNNYTRNEQEKVVAGPDPMIIIPPRHYCVIQNPVHRDKNGKIVFDHLGQAKIRHGDEEIRFEQEPFPLYPGETLYGKVSPLQVVAPNTALKLRAIRDFKEISGAERKAGDEWLFYGPATYIPRVEVQVMEIVRAIIIKPNQALRLRAKKEFIDVTKTLRKAGEEWLIRQPGAFIPAVEEEVVETVSAYILNEKKALHLQAIRTFTDKFGRQRKAGEEWLVTVKDAETHIPDVHEKVIGEVNITVLNNRQYCVVLDPVDAEGKPQLGKRELRKGPVSFFLQPGERLESGIQNIHILDSEEALLLRAREAYKDNDTLRKPGDRWMIHGPCDYVPPVEVEIVEKRRAIPLDENEGIYVRDIKTGRVRAVMGQSYMLKSEEELWEKELPPLVEDLLAQGGFGRVPPSDKESEGAAAAETKSVRLGGSKTPPRDKTRVVTFRAPHNTAVQIYDYKLKRARVVFGPDLIALGPEEHFTVLSLSGDKPKRPHVIKALALNLGPDFMTDFVVVETADHARLSLKLSYNWHFEVDKSNSEDVAKLFQVPDFVGEACKLIAGCVRGAVAQESFDNFHKNSARIIRASVFGLDEHGKIRNHFHFAPNNLVINNIDIQSVEPVDQRTRDALQVSVQLAIEITTKSQEATARHDAERREQEARGMLERQKISDEAEAEKARKELLQLQAQSAAVESTGQATAEAKARAEAQAIEGEAAVKQAQLQSEAAKIKSDVELVVMKMKQEREIIYQKAIDDLEIQRAKELAGIEATKFKSIVQAIGKETLSAIARAGPETQVKLLQSLGLQGYMITDGNTPINLFNTANGLLGQLTNTATQK
jgi:major vault protein